MMKNLKKKKGFTLIELIIVIAILGILAAIAIPKFGNAQKSARLKADISTAKTIADTAAMLMASEEIKSVDEDGTKAVTTGTEGDGEIGIKVGNALQSIPAPQGASGVFHVNITEEGIVKVYISTETDPTISTATQVYPDPGVKNTWYD